MSKSAAVRARAARVLADVVTHGRTLDAALLKEESGNVQERGLLRALSYDSLRWYLRLEAILDQLLARGSKSLQPDVHALAIVGLCQLLHTDIPAHAAVDETVDATRLLRQPRAAPVINAVLRRCQRERGKLEAWVQGDTAKASAHPRWLVDMLERDWGELLPAVLAANNERPPFWLRVNRRLISGSDYCRQLEQRGIAIATRLWNDEALLLQRAVDVTELPGFAAGQVSLQDGAAQLAARLIDAQAGERVLDACAAPGGKTCHVLELQPQLAELLALDVSSERLRKVRDNLQRLQLSATVATGDAAIPSGWWDGVPFQRILLDAPCSATGVIRRHPDIKLLRRAEDIAGLAKRQLALLEGLWPLLAPGGRLVYSTCSILTAENSAVVEAFLGRQSAARDVTAAVLQSLGIAAGPGTGYRIAPGTAGMDGFYYACLEKTSTGASSPIG